MSTREERIALYERGLAELYRPELDYLADTVDGPTQILNTGGGCMAIQATLKHVTDGGHTIELIATTAEPGLAEERSEIIHWYVCLYEIGDDEDALAEGHDLNSFEAAYILALDNLRNKVPPASHLCSALTESAQPRTCLRTRSEVSSI